MKIINEGPGDMLITHPSALRTYLAAGLFALGGVLLWWGLESLTFAIAAALALLAGALALFDNVGESVELDKRAGTLTYRRQAFPRGTVARHALAGVARVALADAEGRPASYIALSDGTRILIDRAHGRVLHSLSDHQSDDAAERTIAARVARFLGTSIIDETRATRRAHQ